MPTGVLNNNQQIPSSFLTPPSTPPNINTVPLHNLDPSYSCYKKQLDYDSVPVLITSHPRQRAQSSPPPPPPPHPSHVYIQEAADSFPVFLPNNHRHQQPCEPFPGPTAQQQPQYHYRRRSSSEPVTPEELQHLQKIYASRPLTAPVSETPSAPQHVHHPPPHQVPPPMMVPTGSPTKVSVQALIRNFHIHYIKLSHLGIFLGFSPEFIL